MFVSDIKICPFEINEYSHWYLDFKKLKGIAENLGYSTSAPKKMHNHGKIN